MENIYPIRLRVSHWPTRCWPKRYWALAFTLLLGSGCAGDVPDASSSTTARGGEAVEPAPDAYTPTAASLPATDIFLATLEVVEDVLRVGEPRNITDRSGYDNQPVFTPDSAALLYTSGPRPSDDGREQTDIYRYDVTSRAVTQITNTPASEYSPTILPDGLGFSTIHEDAASQQLWQFSLDGRDQGGLFDAVQPVGYHAWGSETDVAVFVLGNEDDSTPETLQLIDARSGTASVIAERIGRSLHKIPGRSAISFVHKVSETEWWIKELDLATRETRPLVQTLDGREDYAWTPDGRVVMGNGAGLWQWTASGGWASLVDLGGEGVGEISRLAVAPSGQHIAIVAARQDQPAPK